MKKYVFVNIKQDQLLDPQIGLFKDLIIQSRFDITFNHIYKVFNSKLINFCLRVIFSNKLQSVFKSSQKYFYNFDKVEFSDNQEVCFIIPSVCATKIDINYLKDLKKIHNNFKFVLLLLDSLHAHSYHLQYLKNKIFTDVWDMVLSFDKEDAEEYKFQYLGYKYYSANNAIMPSNKDSDIYYIGALKGNREILIAKIFDFCKENNLNANINVIYKKIQKIGNSNLQTTIVKRFYPEVISEIKSTNCILEVLQEGQKAQSIRYFEAVVYNKKLLSNNPNLKKLPFYDERYMKYFEKVDDIDWEWVAKKENIDYKYNNEFSPIHMLEQIEKYFEGK